MRVVKMSMRMVLAAALALASVPSAWAAPVGSARSVVGVAVPRAQGRALALATATPHSTSPASAPATTSVVVGYERVSETEAVVSAFLMGAKVTRKSKSGEFCVVQVPFGADVAGFVSELSAKPGVEFAEPEVVVSADLASNDPGFSSQWGMTKVGANNAWDESRGSGITVAVIDSGTDLDHEDFVGVPGAYPSRLNTAADYNVITGAMNAEDDNGHGTHVSGIIAATLNNGIGVAGIANQATILPIKVLGADGKGTSSDVAEGIRWAADHGASVINLSLGFTTYSSVVAAAVDYAVGLDPDAPGMDCVVVAATGNTGALGVEYPARYPNVIGVGSTTHLDTLSTFSTYGPETDICAPGENIYSTWYDGSYRMDAGTSMASPFVAGAVALIRAQNPSWTRSQVEARLLSTVDDLGTTGRDNYFGHGRVNAARAVGAPTGPPPASSDDDIPGLVAPASPITGSLDRTTDRNDVYYLDLTAGSTLSAVLNAGSATNFDLYLYGPGTTSLATGIPVGSSTNASYPDVVQYHVSATGRYYFDVLAASGSGSYSLAYGVTAAGAGPDADIPGVALPASPTSGTLDATTDTDDVFSLSLTAGQAISVTMTADAGTDFDLHLFRPGAISVNTDAAAASAISLTYPETLTYVVPASGTYYLDVRAYSGAGHYDFAYLVSSGAPDPDSDVPGVPFATNPETGTLDTTTDTVDVYSILLNAGQTIDIQLHGPASADFDLYLYGPETSSIHDGGTVADSTSPSSEESITYMAVKGGIHYIACYSFSGSGAYSLYADVESDSYTVNCSASGGGSITPVGEWTVAAGGSVTVTMTPNANYHVAGVTVDGSLVGTPTVYRFTNVRANHTIAATFAIERFVITRIASPGGTIAGPSTVAYGADATYTIVPDPGHSIIEVKRDDASLGMTTTVELHNVTGPHTVEATFGGNEFPVSASEGPNGSISPRGTSWVGYGSDSATYTITPDAGYVIGVVAVDGVSRGAVTSFKFANVTGPHSIAVTFLRVTGITISSSRTIIHHGTKVTYSGTMSPNMPNGTHVVVEIRKSSSTTWTKLSTRNTYSSHHWSYTYHTHSRHPGTYYVRVRYPGSATYAGSVSSSKKMILR